MPNETNLILVDQIEPLIHEFRGQKVILDSDLAKLYGVETKALNRAVKRNIERFPSDFLMQLTAEEFESLSFQIGTLKTGRGQHRKVCHEDFSIRSSVTNRFAVYCTTDRDRTA